MPFRRLLARILPALAGTFLAAHAAVASTGNLTWQALIDTDGPASGCPVAVAEQGFDGQAPGVDYILTVQVDPESNTVTSTALAAASCAGRPARTQPQAAAIAAAAGITGAGVRFVEAGVLLSVLGDPAQVAVVHASDDGAGGSDAAFASAGVGNSVSGAPYLLGPDAEVPLLGPLALALLAVALGGLAVRRQPGRALPLLLAGVVLVSGAAWAAAIVIDGDPGDWGAGERQSDASGDASGGGEAQISANYLTDDGSYCICARTSPW